MGNSAGSDFRDGSTVIFLLRALEKKNHGCGKGGKKRKKQSEICRFIFGEKRRNAHAYAVAPARTQFFVGEKNHCGACRFSPGCVLVHSGYFEKNRAGNCFSPEKSVVGNWSCHHHRYSRPCLLEIRSA